MGKPLTNKVGFSEIIGPLRKSLDELYELKRTKKRSASYDGFDLHNSVACTSGQPDYELTAESFAYHRERGRKPIDVILMLAFQLGWSAAKSHEDGEVERRQKHLEEAFEEAWGEKVNLAKK